MIKYIHNIFKLNKYYLNIFIFLIVKYLIHKFTIFHKVLLLNIDNTDSD